MEFDIEDIRAYFANDKYAMKTSGIEIVSASTNYAKCKVNINESHKNAAGFVMGGLIFTLADFTFAVATNRPNKWVVTSTSSINYTAPSKGPVLYSETKCIKDGSSIIILEIDITDDKGVLVAHVVSNGFKQHTK